MSQTENETVSFDPCGEFGPTQKWAAVWFVCVLIGGSALTAWLSSVDNRMYTSGAEYIDWDRYRENRTAAIAIGSERVDPRGMGDLGTAHLRVSREGPRK